MLNVHVYDKGVNVSFLLCRGDYGNSLIHFERAITNQPQVCYIHCTCKNASLCVCVYVSQLASHDEQCIGGLARTALHTGDVRRYMCMCVCVCVCIKGHIIIVCVTYTHVHVRFCVSHCIHYVRVVFF